MLIATKAEFRFVCVIDDGDSALAIGGSKSGVGYYGHVERYSTTGLIETLPSLNINRNHQSCTKYTNSAGEKVSLTLYANVSNLVTLLYVKRFRAKSFPKKT